MLNETVHYHAAEKRYHTIALYSSPECRLAILCKQCHSRHFTSSGIHIFEKLRTHFAIFVHHFRNQRILEIVFTEWTLMDCRSDDGPKLLIRFLYLSLYTHWQRMKNWSQPKTRGVRRISELTYIWWPKLSLRDISSIETDITVRQVSRANILFTRIYWQEVLPSFCDSKFWFSGLWRTALSIPLGLYSVCYHISATWWAETAAHKIPSGWSVFLLYRTASEICPSLCGLIHRTDFLNGFAEM
jgi:hypothetical protein